MKKNPNTSDLRDPASKPIPIGWFLAVYLGGISLFIGCLLYAASPAHADAVWLKDWIYPHDFSAGIYPTIAWGLMIFSSFVATAFLVCFAVYLKLRGKREKENKNDF